MSRCLALLALVGCGHAAAVTPVVQPPAPDPTGPHADAIAAQVQPYLDAEIVNSVVVGVVDGDRTEIYGFGGADGRTIFELGSLTQIFTSLLLVDSVARKEVEYDTPVSQMMPLGVTVPTAEDQKITLEMLATHRSGLPSMPRSLALRQFDADPYAGYNADRLYEDLVTGRLEAVPGTIVNYSAWGVGLLGFSLARNVRTTYAEMVVDRIAKPLGLADTRTDVPAQDEQRFAPGHNEDLVAVSAWHLDALMGAAGLHSTARDMVALLRAEIDAAHGGKGPLADRLRASQEIRIAADPRSLGLGWWIEKDGRLWHNGASGGYHGFVVFDPAKRFGVVVLASTSTSLVDRLGGALMQVLDGKAPPPIAFPDPAQFAALIGRYRVGDAEANVEVRGKRVYLTQQGQAPTRLLPLSATEFFIEEIQAPMAFDVEPGEAHARGLVLFMGGKRLEGARVGDLPTPATAPTGTAPAPAPTTHP
jgi:CubicO group peptidase (beta-lactamase class C family)